MSAVHFGITATRDHALDEVALDVARAWVRQWVEDLERDGRRIEGGWPGTLNEARARCAKPFSTFAPERDELERITRITYAAARRLWKDI